MRYPPSIREQGQCHVQKLTSECCIRSTTNTSPVDIDGEQMDSFPYSSSTGCSRANIHLCIGFSHSNRQINNAYVLILPPNCTSTTIAYWQYFYTVFKKLHHFYFCNNFFIREPIFIIFDDNMREKICNKTYIVFPTTPNLYAPAVPCNTSGKSD